jgi:hypothetical protein
MSKNPKGLWRALEQLADGAVMAAWSRELGHDAERARSFLILANGLAETYPCMNVFGCGYPHRVEERRPGQWSAMCETDDGCPPFTVANKDLFVFAADVKKLCGRISKALGFEASMCRQVAGVRVVPVGTYGAAHSNVYLLFPGDSARMAREVERLFGVQPDPFLLLTPTGIHCSAEVESALRRQSCMHIAMSAALTLADDGSLSPSRVVESLLNEFQRRQADRRALVKTLERIDRSIEAVARDKYNLQKENEELRQLNNDGYFKFAVRVKGEDFLAFAVIMALGNRKAAADHLKIPHRTFYNRVEQWATRGKEYKHMVRYMEWRKRSSRHLKVQLNPSLQSGEAGDQPENPETMADVLTEIKVADNKDYPALLADVLQALERQNAGNWMKVRQELVETIKEDVMQ